MSSPLIPPRKAAGAEFDALLSEITTWTDEMLVHMYARFGTSRLFRVHHDPEGPLTDRAIILRYACRDEMERRGLPVPEDL